METCFLGVLGLSKKEQRWSKPWRLESFRYTVAAAEALKETYLAAKFLGLGDVFLHRAVWICHCALDFGQCRLFFEAL